LWKRESTLYHASIESELNRKEGSYQDSGGSGLYLAGYEENEPTHEWLSKQKAGADSLYAKDKELLLKIIGWR
jgi:hypothetical protein